MIPKRCFFCLMTQFKVKKIQYSPIYISIPLVKMHFKKSVLMIQSFPSDMAIINRNI